jgi:hypothetical protein
MWSGPGGLSLAIKSFWLNRTAPSFRWRTVYQIGPAVRARRSVPSLLRFGRSRVVCDASGRVARNTTYHAVSGKLGPLAR